MCWNWVQLTFRAESSGVVPDPLAVTRAVSPVHIEYLRNMGVGASVNRHSPRAQNCRVGLRHAASYRPVLIERAHK
jgi:hypothetical protein